LLSRGVGLGCLSVLPNEIEEGPSPSDLTGHT
jgi:hypothetical protein